MYGLVIRWNLGHFGNNLENSYIKNRNSRKQEFMIIKPKLLKNNCNKICKLNKLYVPLYSVNKNNHGNKNI